LAHLSYNVVGLLAVGPFVERRLGGGRFLALATVTGGRLRMADRAQPPAHYVDGTSGALFGIIGCFVALTAITRPRKLWPMVGFLLVAAYASAGTLGQPLFTKHLHVAEFIAGIVVCLLFVLGRAEVDSAQAGIVVSRQGVRP
jgi:membrane associated rhomboid family serine protease